MKSLMEKLEHLMELGGTKKDITLLAISGVAVLLSLFGVRPFPFDMAWIAVILCGIPIILEAVIGLVTAFDIKADVLVSLALIASVAIGEDFAAGEVAFIMAIGALLEEATTNRAKKGLKKLIGLAPAQGRRILVEKDMIPCVSPVRKISQDSQLNNEGKQSSRHNDPGAKSQNSQDDLLYPHPAPSPFWSKSR